MDLIRQLLLEIEEKHDWSGQQVFIEMDGSRYNEIVEHLFLLNEAGLIDSIDASHLGGRGIIVLRMTWLGREFLESVRDPDIWRKTKDKAKSAAAMGFGFLMEIAKAEVRLKLGL
jgi:Hypothetical protein (DUF2513)